MFIITNKLTISQNDIIIYLIIIKNIFMHVNIIYTLFFTIDY